MTQPIKKLYRSLTQSQVAGICAGLGGYIGIDPVIIRVIAVVTTIMTGVLPGLLTYAVAWLMIPAEPLPVYAQQPPAPAYAAPPVQHAAPAEPPAPPVPPVQTEQPQGS